MKLAFEPNLAHQAEAVSAIRAALADAPPAVGGAAPGPGGAVVVGNAAADADDREVRDIAVEMETGTGKTYVLVRAALELARSHRYRKFVVVVPTVAIREGVLKTLHVTREHFAALFGSVRHRFFAYRGDVGRISMWARSTDVEFMVLTVDAFNKQSNVLRQAHDRFGGAAPLDVIAACRPVLLLDEPHRFSSALRKQSLAALRPLAVVRFGATVGPHPRKVYTLSPRVAHERGLVKTVQVHAPAVGIADEAIASAQVEAAVAGHLALQSSLVGRGIKVLSLFFLRRVSEYVDADGTVRRAFEMHYNRLRAQSPRFAERPATEVCAAYFAQSSAGRGRAVDSKTGASQADADAYALIMRDKERLLSLEDPVGFIFSHSALREGWDNPNVFGICTLGRSKSELRKRQELGRGMRLCVDQSGRRVTDPAVNMLTVYANESYASYAASLQREVDVAFAEEERPRPPARVGHTVVLPRSTSTAAVWVEFSSAALVERALARFTTMLGPDARGSGTAARGPELLGDTFCAAVAHALVERRPPVPLRSGTIATFLDRLPHTVGREPCIQDCASALAAAVEDLQHAGRAAERGVDREQQ